MDSATRPGAKLVTGFALQGSTPVGDRTTSRPTPKRPQSSETEPSPVSLRISPAAGRWGSW